MSYANCLYCGRRKHTSEFRMAVINGESRITCPCIEDFKTEELENFSAWLKTYEHKDSVLLLGKDAT